MKTIKYLGFIRFFKFNIIKKFLSFSVVLLSVALIANGFFISSIYAEESNLNTTVEYKVVGGLDSTGDPEPLTIENGKVGDIYNLSLSDNDRMSSSSVWPASGTYEEDKFIEFEFDIDIPEDAIISSVILTNEYKNSTTTKISSAKLEIWDGENFTEQDLIVKNDITDSLETFNITSILDTPDKVNSTKIRFIAYRDTKGQSKTSHDFIGLSVSYNIPDVEPVDDGPAVFTTISNDITEDTHWIAENSPYFIANDISVADGKTLTIDPGVVIKFEYEANLIIEGKIEAIGTELNPIYFTSLYDDSVGGGTNNDNSDLSPYLDDWGRIVFVSSDEGSILENVFSNYSSDGLMILNGSYLSLNKYKSDNGVCIFGSYGNFSNIEIPLVEMYEKSRVIVSNSNILSNDNHLIVLSGESFLDIKNSKIKGDKDNFIAIYNGSSAVFNDITIEGVEGSGGGVVVYENSSLTVSNSDILSVYNGFNVYNDSSFVANNISLSCENEGILAYNNSSISLSKSDISCKNKGLYLYGDSNGSVNESKIHGSGTGVMIHQNFDTDAIKINKSEIFNNNVGVLIFFSDIIASENSIHDNSSFGVVSYDVDPYTLYNYNFVSNFWGDKTGPTHSSNASGLGDPISDNIKYSPFLETDPLIVKVRNPVILIPGITGSYLVRDYGDKSEIWPDVAKLIFSPFDKSLNELILNEDGTENIEFPILVGDILRGISIPAIKEIHVFDLLIENLKSNGYVEGRDLFVFPYDWRVSTSEISIKLKDKIEEAVSNSGSDKVDIVAHSMGGLVAKKYIKDYGEEKIDQLIFLGTPQLGSPKAFKALMYGDNMGYGFDIYKEKNIKLNFLNSNRTKIISQNMPSVYELLPSIKYIEQNGKYVINALSEIMIPGTSFSLDYFGTKNIMIKEGRNPLMFPFAEKLHESIDDLDLSNIKSYNFVGCGSVTIGEIKMKQKRSWKNLFLGLVPDYAIKYIDGDETVPLISSAKTIGSDIYYSRGVSHGSLPASPSIIKNITAVLKGEDLLIDETFQDNDSSCGVEGKIVSTHSPVELHIYDEDGNHTGFLDNGDFEYGIEGITFDMIEGENYAFLPNNRNFRIVTKATDVGGYNFLIEDQNKEEVIVNTYDWTLVPLTTLDTIGEIWIGPSYLPELYNLKIDEDGDGVFDVNYKEGFDGTSIAERFMKNQGQTSSSHIVGYLPKFVEKSVEDKSQNVSGSIENTQIEKVNKITYGEKISKEINHKIGNKDSDKVVETKEDVEGNLFASVGLSKINSKTGVVFTSIGFGILVVLLAIKLIFKIK